MLITFILDYIYTKNAVNAYHKYIDNNNLGIENPEEAILNFLEWDAAYEDKFAEDVRIILVSADFSKEVTSSVLWLLDTIKSS